MKNKYLINSENLSIFTTSEIGGVGFNSTLFSLKECALNIVVMSAWGQWYKLVSKDGLYFSAYKVK